MVESEELGGEQIKDRPRERTSCSVSESILELKLWIPLLVMELNMGGRRWGSVRVALGKVAVGGGEGVKGDEGGCGGRGLLRGVEERGSIKA